MALGGGNCGSGEFLGFKPWYDGLCAGNSRGDEIQQPSNNDEVVTFVWTIILNILFDLTLAIGYIALALIIYGGYLYIMSQGDPVRIAKGKKTLTSAVIGVVIAMTASIIVNTLTFVLGIDPAAGWNQNSVNAERLQGVFNWAYGMAGLVAVVFIVKGGFDYMLSRGNSEKVRKATHSIIYAVAGLIVVLLAAAITAFVLGSIGNATVTTP